MSRLRSRRVSVNYGEGEDMRRQLLNERIEQADPDGQYWQTRCDRALAALSRRMNYLAYVGWHNTHAAGLSWREFCEAAEAKLQELGR
jgi:hypothetical protein